MATYATNHWSCCFRSSVVPEVQTYSLDYIRCVYGQLFSGVLFHTNSVDPGGTATNNLWIIWTGMYLLIILVSIIIELVSRFRNRANNDSRHQ